MNTPRSFLVAAAPRTVSTRLATLLTVAFNAELPANNDKLVPDAIAALEDCKLEGGDIVLVNGPASLPVAMAIGHALSHIFAVVAAFDPKMKGYVVSMAHGDVGYKPGDFIAAADVQG